MPNVLTTVQEFGTKTSGQRPRVLALMTDACTEQELTKAESTGATLPTTLLFWARIMAGAGVCAARDL